MTPQEALDRLEALRASLRNGDLSSLDGAEQALGRIEAASAGWDREALTRVAISARHLGDVMQASARGVRAARRRIAEVSAVRDSGGTYDSNGRKSAPAAQPTRDARA